jgi:hypothetical protein
MGSKSQPQTQVTESSGGSSSTTTTQPYQQDFYGQMLGQAQNLYTQGLPEYYPGQTVAGFTPAQLESMNQTANYVTDEAQGMMGNVNSRYMDMLSGRVDTGPGSPYGDLAQAYTGQALDQAQDVMAQLRSQQIGYQQGGSSRGDLLNERVMEDTNEQISRNLAAMYGGAYQQAQQQQMGALGQYGNIMQMPLQMSRSLYNMVGVPQQQLNQATMNDLKARYDYDAMRPYQNLAQFGNMSRGNYGGSVFSESGSEGTSTTRLV